MTSTKSQTCPQCQEVVPAGSRFCPLCGVKIPPDDGSGVKIGDVGFIRELNIGGKEKPSGPEGDYCPICGVWVKTEASFRCRQCGRTHLHVEHRHPTLGVCVECAPGEPPEAKPVPVVVPAAPGKKEHGDRFTLTLAPGVEMEFVRVPAGAFLMGSGEEYPDALEDEKPQHKVYLDEYWIGRYPVTNAQYQAFVDAAGHAAPGGWEDGRIPRGKNEHPVVLVSWADAQAFCAWVREVSGEEIRLPSEAEWEKAARGADGRKYPWGDQKPDVDLCNSNENVGDTTRVGRYSSQGDSPYGCVDMAGNVWEWTSSLWGKEASKLDFPYPYKAGDGREDQNSAGLRVLRGGSWSLSEYFVRSASRFRYAPTRTNNFFGFRCSRRAASP